MPTGTRRRGLQADVVVSFMLRVMLATEQVHHDGLVHLGQLARIEVGVRGQRRANDGFARLRPPRHAHAISVHVFGARKLILSTAIKRTVLIDARIDCNGCAALTRWISSASHEQPSVFSAGLRRTQRSRNCCTVAVRRTGSELVDQQIEHLREGLQPLSIDAGHEHDAPDVDLRRRFDACHAGHVHVEKAQHVGPQRFEAIDRFAAIAGAWNDFKLGPCGCALPTE